LKIKYKKIEWERNYGNRIFVWWKRKLDYHDPNRDTLGCRLVALLWLVLEKSIALLRTMLETMLEESVAILNPILGTVSAKMGREESDQRKFKIKDTKSIKGESYAYFR